MSLLSGNNPALDALRMWLKDRETASTNVFDTLKNVIYSPGLAQLLSHSSVANPNALAAALLNDLPLFPHNLPSEALSSMTPAAGDTGKDTSSAVVYESMSMAAPDPMASWHANELASAVMAECEGTSAGGAVQALSKLAADGLDEHERVHQVFQKVTISNLWSSFCGVGTDILSSSSGKDLSKTTGYLYAYCVKVKPSWEYAIQTIKRCTYRLWITKGWIR